ncbi:hypothetical protein PHYSODRAFT_258989 [Phytophthora sojae]|uniref:Uncharacterized protein n=1 Tax=Phytophthora sojae (strain P6497) TaxID=1094619 RepID=G5AHI9_PHYSP|nr:hypothetical protein PHYSODRAFT_258989 [Phytophthora sojae]EGZ05031.1 hypothetical protein PHYSODRAFT_258989 [Phytophthora sojae]|eukprot:XP_009539540.1 hypothetical protein PHYSODRAFT_258989 [Phytophthora sojae]
MCNTTLRQNRGLDIPVTSKQNLYVRPGEHATVEIKYGYSNPQKEGVWAGRGDLWVTCINYAAKSWARSVKVVNISNQMTLVYENTPSPEERTKQMELEDFEWAHQPPAVKPAEYPWPSKIQVMIDRKKKTCKEIPLQTRPQSLRAGVARAQPKIMCDMAVQTCTMVEIGTQTGPIVLGQEEMSEKTLDVNEPDIPVETASETEPEAEPVRPELPGQDVPDEDEELDDRPSCAMVSTPVWRLEEEYIRCMRASQEDLDYEPAVYLREGSEVMSQLREELAMLPELKDLSPECDISKADVGEPGRTSPGEVGKLRNILEYLCKISWEMEMLPPPWPGAWYVIWT